MLWLDVIVEDTPTGQFRVITSAAITPAGGGAYSGFDVESEIQAIVDSNPRHRFGGEIVARPLDPGGVPWRYVIIGRHVRRQEARLVWPDGASAAQ